MKRSLRTRTLEPIYLFLCLLGPYYFLMLQSKAETLLPMRVTEIYPVVTDVLRKLIARPASRLPSREFIHNYKQTLSYQALVFTFCTNLNGYQVG